MKIKTITFCFVIMIFSCVTQQSAIDAIGNSANKSDKGSYINELEAIVNQVSTNYGINLKTFKALFSIRGIDITTRDVAGRIWNEEITIYYDYNEINGFHESGRIDTVCYEPVLPTDGFDPLIESIELNDFQAIKDYASDNEVLSGWFWTVTSANQSISGKHEIKRLNLSDFYYVE